VPSASRIEAVAASSSGLQLTLDVGRLEVAWSSAGVLRLHLVPPDGPAPVVAEMVPEFAVDPDVVASWGSPAPGAIDLRLGALHRLVIDSDPLRLTLLAEGRVVWQSVAGRTLRVDVHGRRWLHHVLDDTHLVYGLGEKSGRLVRNHRSLQLKSVDAAGYDPETGDPLYKHVPFYLVHQPGHGRTIGVFCNNAWAARFDFGAERSAYWPPYASICVDGGDLDLFLLTGPTLGDVLRQYCELTGFPALPSKASLGYLGSSMYYTELPDGCDEAVLGFADRCAKEGVELSGFHLSSGYTKGADGRRYALTWNRRGFPQPQEFVSRFQRSGLVLSANVKPAMLTTHPLWQSFDRAAAFITSEEGGSVTEQFWGGAASLVDFSNPAARALWREHLVEALISLGVTSIWNDNNEFELDTDGALCDNDGVPVPADAIRPVLANLMARVAWETVAETTDARPFILSRAGYAGLQKYAQTWSGDNTSNWANFHFNLATMLGTGMSGMPFTGMDIGGFTGPAPQPELFARWVQNGVLHPRFSIHSVNSDNTVTEPWLYPELTEMIADQIRLRYALLPTLYSAAAQAHESGLPVARPLVLEFPDFAPGFDRHTEFLVGSALLAVAVTSPGAPELEVCFPPGEWTDFWTGERVAGGRLVPVPLRGDRSPLYYRSGCGFFLDGRFLDRSGSEAGTLVVRLAMRIDGAAELYDDDGRTRAHEAGVHLHSSWRWTRSQRGLCLEHESSGPFVPAWQWLRLELDIGPIAPVNVAWAGADGAGHEPRRSLRPVSSADEWYFDAGLQRLYLWLPGAALRGAWTLELDLARGMQVSVEPAPEPPAGG
jgi:alpha-glucosidase